MTAEIRKPRPQDEPRWRELFAAYNRFYRARVPDDIAGATWARILDENVDVGALLAEVEGKVVGFANYVFHASTWNTRPSCYLEDLFVDPQARGADAARALIEGVEAAARDGGAFRLYWHTQEYNAPARSLYDTIASRSSFIVYRKAL